MNYSFKPITEKDFQLLHKWFNQKWVAENWDGPKSLGQIREKQRKKMKSKKEFPYIIFSHDQPIAYIQLYDCFELGGGWWEEMVEGDFGIDTFIGEKEFLGKGHGPKYIREFVKKIFEEKGAKKIIVDPKPDNTRAIRAYEKAGFKKAYKTTTPDGEALIMEIYPGEI